MYPQLSIYIHYPFCKSKCPYCDFNSHVKDHINHQHFLDGYLRELDFFAPKLKQRNVTTIFFGGGTPSLMPIFLVEKILEKIEQIWNVDKDCEITLEANPTSFEAGKFKLFKRAGINRLSIGIQALNDQDLQFLGREHNAKEAMHTIETASHIFDNFSFDLIYARPNQTLGTWENELRTAIKFGTKHLSLYQLTIEKGTRFFSQYRRGEFDMPSEELSAQFYETTNAIAQDHGFGLYEISNYAKPSFECKHNLVYWRGGDYLGIGAGAHSRVYFDDVKQRQALMMIHEPTAWLKKVEHGGAGIQSHEEITDEELFEELILMGLRLKDGMNFDRKLSNIFIVEKLKMLVKQGLIEIDGTNIRIPDSARLLTNAIIAKVVDALDRDC